MCSPKWLMVFALALALCLPVACGDDDDDDDDKGPTAEEAFCDGYEDQGDCAWCWEYGVMYHEWHDPTNPIEFWAADCMKWLGDSEDDYYGCLYETCDFESIELQGDFADCIILCN